jgi:hypothetical protein
MADFVDLRNEQTNPTESYVVNACRWIVEKLSGGKFKWTRKSDSGKCNIKSEIHAKPECQLRRTTRRKGRHVVQTIQRDCYCDRRLEWLFGCLFDSC